MPGKGPGPSAQELPWLQRFKQGPHPRHHASLSSVRALETHTRPWQAQSTELASLLQLGSVGTKGGEP